MSHSFPTHGISVNLKVKTQGQRSRLHYFLTTIRTILFQESLYSYTWYFSEVDRTVANNLVQELNQVLLNKIQYNKIK